MSVAVLDLPNLRRGKHAGERRVLAEPLAFFRLGDQQRANVSQRTRQNGLPLRITAQERRRIGVSLSPAGKVLPREVEQLRTGAQARRHQAGKREADFVNPEMVHDRSLAAGRADFEQGFPGRNGSRFPGKAVR